MKWASALSRSGNLKEAVDQAVEELCLRLGSREPDLLIAFASPSLVEGADVAELLHARLPKAVLVGCSGEGIIGANHEVEGAPALSLTGAILPGVRLVPFHLDMNQLPEPGEKPEAWHQLLRISPEARPSLLLVVDPFTCDAEALVAGLDRAYPGALKVGGLASGSRMPGSTRLFLGGNSWRTGAVGLAMMGNVVVDSIVAQGCRPIGTPMLVTRCEGNELLKLNERSPIEVLRELHQSLDERDQALFRHSLFLGFEMKKDQVEYQQGDFLVRNIAGVDPQSGAITVGATLEPYQAVQFHLRDARTAAEDLTRMLHRYREERGQVAAPRGALLFSCLGRGMHLYGRPDHDTSLFEGALGSVPLGGFFCNGEIGPVGGTTFLHGYTSAFALFREAQLAS
ncbi:FIST signal transduction protein [Hyalangium rubrum]|uniref:FIST N-terminal domain-containing protein n=1 Tax=Hyalangium rubrum TaxID=3103134 RepID=A0ABU5H7W7_9BACT|nr:FIST N-terminal domain-containing protein [Hyalangium sp. s54d21]MDY7229194.1 FIST N-terminal domain-containing protein [Hyalangium sp. s54d21]